jgi:hypothetical protein
MRSRENQTQHMRQRERIKDTHINENSVLNQFAFYYLLRLSSIK